MLEILGDDQDKLLGPLFTAQSIMMAKMYVEAVLEYALPNRPRLVQDFMKIECRQCGAAYHLYHDGAGLKLLRDYFLRASRQISAEHPNHRRVIVLEKQSITAHKRAS